jgi:hypothetical protein
MEYQQYSRIFVEIEVIQIFRYSFIYSLIMFYCNKV